MRISSTNSYAFTQNYQNTAHSSQGSESLFMKSFNFAMQQKPSQEAIKAIDAARLEFYASNTQGELTQNSYNQSLQKLTHSMKNILEKYKNDEQKFDYLSQAFALFTHSLNPENNVLPDIKSSSNFFNPKLDFNNTQSLPSLVEQKAKAYIKSLKNEDKDSEARLLELRASLQELENHGEYIKMNAELFYSAIWSDLSASEQNSFLQNVSTISAYYYEQAHNFTLSDGTMLNWSEENGTFKITIQGFDNEKLDLIQLANDKKKFQTLFEIFEPKNRSENNEIKTHKNEKNLTSNSSNSSLLQRALQELE
ncbi:hypothetical protein DMB95_08660 [Campylobacter sp. MIT 12-8780]|uniref:hypothetical protein n=1 Tax=unclassified Campylobacter TaxID=2593542 RepID=UPI00115CB63E|nr:MULTISPECIES: hypothetical protein [unclassified Campylobacter]NDJ27976.1 hypothetical protein [Campylobacter sp. MIT 19-121]TQR40093.1 hypothetical protein DMB95_08660 [Campylobacter sp. MIT 12-8780]